MPRQGFKGLGKESRVKRFRPVLIVAGGTAILALTFAVASAGAATSKPAARGIKGSLRAYHEPLCQSRASLCADAYDSPGDDYVGHDEPSVLFKSGIPGSGNDITYTMTLPKDPKKFPTA